MKNNLCYLCLARITQALGKSKFVQRLFAILWITSRMVECSHFFSNSVSMSLLAFPDFSWRRCFWISSIDGTSWLTGKRSEMYCNSQTKSGRLPLSSLGGSVSVWCSWLKCFLKWSSIFSGEAFSRSWF